MDNTYVSNYLRDARALIDTPERWTRLQFSCTVNGGKAYCASAAIYVAVKHLRRAERVCTHLQDAIKRHTGLNRRIVQWNDAPGRTHHEIMQAFCWAIDDADRAMPDGQ